MAKAIDVANALRMLASHIEKGGDTEIVTPNIYFSTFDQKDLFLAVAKLLPRPLVKLYGEGDYADLKLDYTTDDIYVTARIQRSVMCRLVEPAQPAKYECEPLLNVDELAGVE
jgi:hypothetical protein